MRFAPLAVAALLICGCASTHKDACCEEKGEKGEKDEVKMTMDQIPAAAREGISREAKGAKVDEVDKETKDGKTIYEADVVVDGKNWEIIVDGNGKLVSKKLDEGEDKDKKAEKEDDEKDEKK